MDRYIDNKKTIILLLIAFLIAAFVFLGYGCYSVLKTTNSFFDGSLRYVESKLVLEGVDPFDKLMLTADEYRESLPEPSELPTFAGNLPWVYILSNVVIPAYIQSWSVARLVSLFIYCLLASLCAVCIYKYIIKRLKREGIETENKKYFAGMCVCAFFAQMAVFLAIKWGNHSFVVCSALMIFITLDHDKNWLLSGLLMTLAMLKPQTAFLFFIPLLVKKQWKPILTAAVLVVAAWAATVLLTGSGFIEMVTEMYAQGIGYKEEGQNAIYYGIFDFLSEFGVSSKIFMPIGMLLCSAATFWFSYRYKNSDDITLYAIPAVFSTMWMYSHPYDWQIAGVLSLALLFVIFTKKTSGFFKIAAIAAIAAIAMPIVPSWNYITPIIPLAFKAVNILGLVVLLRREEGISRCMTV